MSFISVCNILRWLTQIRIKRHTDDETGLTWAGQSFDTPGDASPQGELNVTKVDVLNGTFTIELNASEVVLLTLC